MKTLSHLLILFAALLLTGGCNNSSDDPVFDAVAQAKADEATLKAYFQAKNLTDSVTKTSSGLYYRITKRIVRTKPTDSLITNGKRVFVRYEGKLLNGTLFDSNLLSATAFRFVPGAGSVIRGWEEGILHFRNGEEGYLYLPSGLAYANSATGNIPANSCLQFFIRVVNVE